MEEHPQGVRLRPPEGPGTVQPPELQRQPGLQGLGPEEAPVLLQLGQQLGGGVLGDQRIQLPPVQPVQQPGAGPDDGPGLQGGPGQGGEKFFLQSRQDLGQVPVRAEDAVGQDQNPSPFPSSWAAPAAQVWMSRTPTRPRMVR